MLVPTPCHRLVLVAALLCLSSAIAFSATDESSGRITTADGSSIPGQIAHSGPWTIATSNGVQTLDFAAVERIEFGERVDPNIENDATVAVGKLQSDKFDIREKAEAKLRKIGRAAAKPLKQALTSPDAEVAKRARELLAESGAADDERFTQDRVYLRDGKTVLRGELSIADVLIRTRFGKLRVPVEAIDSIQFGNGDPAAQKNNAPLAAADAKEIAVPLPPAGHVEAAAAVRWDPNEDVQADPEALDGWLAEVQRNALTMDKLPGKKDDKNPDPKPVDTKAGDRMESAYRDRGVELHATEAGSSVEVSADKLAGFSGGRCAAAKKSDFEVRFFLPKANGTESSTPAGVLHAGAIVRTEGPGTVAIAAYDSAGRLLAKVLNTGDVGAPINPNAAAAANPNPVMGHDEFLGIRSSTPIARIRFFRVGAFKEKNDDLLVDDIVFDRIATAGLRGDACRVTLISGEQLVGKTVAVETGSVALKAEFLGEKADSLSFKLDAVARYEPARERIVKEPAPEEKADDDKPRRFGSPHGILLQSGETFRARLLALNDKEVMLGLSVGAILKLPRETLRKIEFIPPDHEPGEPLPKVAIAKDEKPGVEFKSKPHGKDAAAPQLPPAEKDEKKDPAKNPAQGLKRMDDVEILRVDPKSWELTVKDEDGEFTMGIQGVKLLVFPPNPNAGVTAKKRGWTLTLREGSHFDAEIVKITPKDITAEMAGGTVILPAETIESVERK